MQGHKMTLDSRGTRLENAINAWRGAPRVVKKKYGPLASWDVSEIEGTWYPTLVLSKAFD